MHLGLANVTWALLDIEKLLMAPILSATVSIISIVHCLWIETLSSLLIQITEEWGVGGKNNLQSSLQHDREYGPGPVICENGRWFRGQWWQQGCVNTMKKVSTRNGNRDTNPDSSTRVQSHWKLVTAPPSRTTLSPQTVYPLLSCLDQELSRDRPSKGRADSLFIFLDPDYSLKRKNDGRQPKTT